MPIEVILPRVDMDMSFGTIVSWHRSEGDSVKKGDALLDIETDKATMEVTSPGTGVLHFVSAKEGDVIPIGQAIGWIFLAGEDVVAPVISASRREKIDPGSDVEPIESAPIAEPSADCSQKNGIRATPLARYLARKFKIDLAQLVGSGPRGRITRTDVEVASRQFINLGAQKQTIDAGHKTGAERIAQELGLTYKTMPVNNMRKIIATRLSESRACIPHFDLDADIEIDALMAMRNQLNSAIDKTCPRKISINDLLISACAMTLQAVPDANVSWDGNTIILYDDVHISVAVALNDGVLTPVVRNAQRKDIQTISAEMADLTIRAKAGKLSRKEYQGGSFSLSNLGMFGVKSFSAIINPPESMILAVGQGTQQFIPDHEGRPRLATIMHVRLSCDHRVIDGALGAIWLKKFKEVIEKPAAMILS